MEDLAHALAMVALVLEVLGHRHGVRQRGPEMRREIPDPGGVGPTAGHERGARRTAHGLLAVGPVEGRAAGRDTVQIRRLDERAPGGVRFGPEVIDGEEAIQVCRKPRSGEAVYAFKLANLESLENPPRRPRTEKAPTASTSGPDPSSTKPPPSKRLRTDPGSPSGRTSQPIKNNSNLFKN